MKGRIAGLAMLLACAAGVAGVANARDSKPEPVPPPPPSGRAAPSLYLQCDGNPNNMSAGESIGRFIGAITLLGLFAPAVESPNPGARLFGKAGVGACSELIDGAHRESNTTRRLPLLLGRAIHRIEAKDYKAAATDVTLARNEAKAAGLADDPYFARSLGLSLDMLEAEALFAAGDIAGARAVSLRRAEQYRYGYYALVGLEGYRPFAAPPSPLELAGAEELSRFTPSARAADILEEQGDFREAAVRLDEMQAFIDTMLSKETSPMLLARGAVDRALAGDWEGAARHAADARASFAEHETAGKPDDNGAAIVEMLDLHDLLASAHIGKLVEARRGYGARSRWLSASFGQTAAALALLRAGAKPEELTGALAISPEALWTRRRDDALAARLELYKNNRFLWQRILPYASAPEYERLSRTVWDGAKARYLSKQPVKDSKSLVVAVSSAPLTQVDAALLHLAVVAKARGYKGFYFFMLPKMPGSGLVRFATPDTPVIPSQFVDADVVIGELSAVIPTPANVAARQAERDRKAR